jgi:hypothetical protein
MDNSFRQQETETQQSNGFFVSLQVFNGILQWLASLVRLTEEEQENAGIYLDGIRDK